MNVLDAIGNTSLAELRKVVPRDSARIFAKLDGACTNVLSHRSRARTMVLRMWGGARSAGQA